MSIETTYNVKRSDALAMLRQKGITVFDDDCRDRLGCLLDENKETIFENYLVIEDDEESNWPFVRHGWD